MLDDIMARIHPSPVGRLSGPDPRRDAGRDPAALAVSLFFLNDEMQSAATLAEARDTGATRAILRLPPGDEGVVLKTLDEYARRLV